MIITILLIPSNDHTSLFSNGICGEQAPTMYQSTGCGVGHSSRWLLYDKWAKRGICYMCESPNISLVLAYSTEVNRHGALWMADVIQPSRTSTYIFGEILVSIDEAIREQAPARLVAMVEVHLPEFVLVFLDANGVKATDRVPVVPRITPTP